MTDTPTSNFKKYRIPFITAALAALTSGVIFILPAPQSTQLYENKETYTLNISVTPDILIDLDSNSAMTVTNSKPLSVELLHGNAYFEINNEELKITSGSINVTATATHFSLEKLTTGNRIAISDGQVSINIGALTQDINAGQQIDFDNSKAIKEVSITGSDVATWRKNN